MASVAGAFQSKPQIVMQLEGGLTNISFLVEAGSERAVLRMNNPDASRLGVDRHAEITILENYSSRILSPDCIIQIAVFW